MIYKYEDGCLTIREYNPVLIYSFWDGYLKADKDYANRELIELVDAWKGNVVHLHTSGHASPGTIAKVIKAVNTSDAIVPVHTENPEGFRNMNLDIKYIHLLQM